MTQSREDERRNGDLLRTEQETLSEVGRLKVDIAIVKTKIESIREDLQTLITRAEFKPVQLIAYGLASSCLAALLAAVLSVVIRH